MYIDGDAIKLTFKEIAATSANFGSDAARPLESDVFHTVLEPVIQDPASTAHFLDGHQLHIPPPISHNLNFGGPTKFLPGAPRANTADLRNADSNSSGSARPLPEQREEGTPGTRESCSVHTTTINTAMGGYFSPPISDVLAVTTEPMAEEATSAEAWMGENPPQTPTDASGNFQFPIERQSQARECTAGTEPFSMDDANFDDLQDSDEEVSIVEPARGSRLHRPPSPIPPHLKWSLRKSAPLTIPVPDTLLQFFFSCNPQPPSGHLPLYISQEAALSTPLILTIASSMM